MAQAPGQPNGPIIPVRGGPFPSGSEFDIFQVMASTLGITAVNQSLLVIGNTAGQILVRGTNIWEVGRLGNGLSIIQSSGNVLLLTESIAQVAITGVASTSGGGIASWIPTDIFPAIVTRVMLDVSVKSTGAANVSIGTAASATTSAANLIDTLDVGTATGQFDNFGNHGTLGKFFAHLAASPGALTVTGSADTTGLNALLTIWYIGATT